MISLDGLLPGCFITYNLYWYVAITPFFVLQLGMNPLFRINPFSAPETILEGRAITQEQLFFNTLNFDSSRPNKTELGNSFLTLLSPENYHLPNSRLSLAKLPVNKGSTVNMTSCTLPITTIPPLAENQRNSTLENIKELSLLASSRSLSMLKSSVLQSTLTEAGPSTHGMDCNDVFSNQPSRAHSTNTATSSLLSDWPNSANSNNAIKVQTSNFQPSQKFPVEIKSSSSSHASAFGKGPLVLCINTGEWAFVMLASNMYRLLLFGDLLKSFFFFKFFLANRTFYIVRWF